MPVIEPEARDEALLQKILSASPDPAVAHLWWLGQSGFLLKWQQHYLLVDPYLSDSLTKKYAGTQMEHVRMTARCLSPEKLGFVSLVLSSHAHTDHMDPETLTALASAAGAEGRRLRVVLSPANIPVARQKLGPAPIDWVPLDAGEDMAIEGISIHALPSAHTELKQDADGHHFYLGFIIRLGSFGIYHSGDTVLYTGLSAALLTQKPQVMLLPINGNRPERGVAGNLNGTEAALLAKTVGAKIAIPHHFDMFAFNTEKPDEFVGACQRLDQPCRVLKCGEQLTLSLKPAKT